jgi:hypothetical protein
MEVQMIESFLPYIRLSDLSASETESKADFEKQILLYTNLYLKMMEKAQEFNEKVEAEITYIVDAKKSIQ